MAVTFVIVGESHVLVAAPRNQPERKFLYVATSGIRDYLQYGGHGVLVFDISDGHRFVKRIPSTGLGPNGQPLNVKGICANVAVSFRFEPGCVR